MEETHTYAHTHKKILYANKTQVTRRVTFLSSDYMRVINGDTEFNISSGKQCEGRLLLITQSDVSWVDGEEGGRERMERTVQKEKKKIEREIIKTLGKQYVLGR